jgi:hypothetical protein
MISTRALSIVQVLTEVGQSGLPSAPPSKGRSLDGIVIRLSIYARDLVLLMTLHPSICGCNLFVVVLHLLLVLLFLWT